jgi:RNA polymerase sigma-70 factor (ECF subfamily)
VLDLKSPASRLIIARAQSGDRAALDLVLGALQPPLYRHILALVRDPDDARDALQETLMRIARKLPSLREVVWLRAWAYRIATREAVRQARTARRWRDALRDDEALESLAAVNADDPTDGALVAAAPELLAALSPASEVVIRMHFLDGLTYVEIAEALEIPVGTVKSRLAYGLTVMRRAVGATKA